MKRRITTVLNFFAFNLLFFALYLNFIHKDSNAVSITPGNTATPTIKGTVLVENPEQYLNKQAELTNEPTSAIHTSALNHAFN